MGCRGGSAISGEELKFEGSKLLTHEVGRVNGAVREGSGEDGGGYTISAVSLA